jgi:tRNA-dihydrouridine synthase 1
MTAATPKSDSSNNRPLVAAAAAEATAASGNPLPVDRQWLRKLLRRHGRPDDEPPLVLAPMVDQSDLPFRLLCRDYGINICFTPMIHAKIFMTSKAYRQAFTLEHTPDRDRPLIAQICGSDVDMVVQCAKYLEPYCDGIDLNCGW